MPSCISRARRSRSSKPARSRRAAKISDTSRLGLCARPARRPHAGRVVEGRRRGHARAPRPRCGRPSGRAARPPSAAGPRRRPAIAPASAVPDATPAPAATRAASGPRGPGPARAPARLPRRASGTAGSLAEADEHGAASGRDCGVHGVEQQLGAGGRVETAVDGPGERVQPAQQDRRLAGGRRLRGRPRRRRRRPARAGRSRAQQAAEEGQPAPLQPAGRQRRVQVAGQGGRARG